VPKQTFGEDPLLQSATGRFVDTILDRATSNFNRRSRIFAAVFSVLGVALSCCPRAVLSALLWLPKKLVTRPRIRLGIANTLFQLDYPAEALRYLERSSGGKSPSSDETVLRAMCLYQGLDRFGEAIATLTEANERRHDEAKRLGLADLPYRVLGRVWASHIGHTAMLDYVIKLGALEGRSPEDTILYVPRDSRVANRFLLEQIATKLRLVEDPERLPFPASAVAALQFDLLGPRLPDGRTSYYWNAAGETYTRWENEGRPPLLTLPPEIQARGWSALHRAGLPQNAWFVALHVREDMWSGRNPGTHGIRNADISSYFAAIAEITRRGGWVIRMGDLSMTPLPQLANVIDYCHSDMRSDWMDIFLVACSRFMVATNSGPAFIPLFYGAPSVLTNWWPAGERPWRSTDIFVPKMLRSLSDGRYLTLNESLREPVCWSYSRRYLAKRAGMSLADSDPKMILGAVVEMLDRLEGKLEQDAELEKLRARTDRIYRSNNISGMAPLARDFLRCHADLIS
jgi:putative glycosyltransferase (TIGR04372 family)